MNRILRISAGVLAIAGAVVVLGVWRTAPPVMLGEVALPDTWNGQTLARDGVAVDFKLQPLASDGKLREGEFADVQFRITEGASGQPLSGVAPGAWIDPQTLAADQAQGRDQSCKSRVGMFLKSNIGARPLLDLNSYFLLVMNRDASVAVVDPSVSVGGITSTMTRIESNSRRWTGSRQRTTNGVFVSMPTAGEVAVIDSEQFKVLDSVAAGSNRCASHCNRTNACCGSATTPAKREAIRG
jgi:hypothetical protein